MCIDMTKIETLEKKLNRIDRRLRAYTEKPLSTKEAAEYLCISVSTIHKLTSKGEVTHYKPNGKQMYFKKVDLRKYAFANKQKSVEELVNSITIKNKK